MKIGPLSEPQGGQNAPAAKRAGQDAEAAHVAKSTAATPTAGASVSVSTLSRTLEQANRGESQDIDHVKVDAIRTAIDDGSYQVDAEAIADKMLSDSQQMLAPKRSH